MQSHTGRARCTSDCGQALAVLVRRRAASGLEATGHRPMLYGLPLVSCPIDTSHRPKSSIMQGSNDTLLAVHANGLAEMIGRGESVYQLALAIPAYCMISAVADISVSTFQSSNPLTIHTSYLDVLV